MEARTDPAGGEARAGQDRRVPAAHGGASGGAGHRPVAAQNAGTDGRLAKDSRGG